jgi:hypothetical protein
MKSIRGNVALTAVFVSALAAPAAGCGPAGPFSSISTEIQSVTLTEPLTRLVFTDLRSGSLFVKAGKGSAAEITRKLVWRGTKPPRYTETFQEQTLNISYECDLRDCSIDYSVVVPEGVEVRAKTSSGDVEVTAMAGPVDVRTTSGDVRLTAVKGAVTVEVTSGDVTGEDLACARADISTTSGDVNLGFVTAPQEIRRRGTSGDTTILVPGDVSQGREPYAVEVRTNSGDQTINVDRSQSATRKIEVESTSGDVRIDYGRARSGGTPSPS